MKNLEFQKHLLIKRTNPIGDIYGFSYYTELQKEHIIKVFNKASTMKCKIKYLNRQFNKLLEKQTTNNAKCICSDISNIIF